MPLRHDSIECRALRDLTIMLLAFMGLGTMAALIFWTAAFYLFIMPGK